ncbi:Anaphase-promoting complex subunit 1 protein [Dioscorea alata]|uniref:Anaphase-promoting complex subunit 1 protein n=1 Tax=Dioscorea alata TaxID=55571 RepID=A0ACB7VTW7_DIOAL|nr:Anaphase-promoting complex subunit 1 protein [Dioscorea alata]
MSVGVRNLAVLGEFKPFGLKAEEQDGEPVDALPDKYDYFLFDPAVARERDELFSPSHEFSTPDPPSTSGDHEIFIRGNRIIWSMGSQVHKRYTASNSIIMACWCRMDAISDALLCVLQVDSISIYYTSGEVVCIPLPYGIASIWPLPFGLLMQKSMDGSRPISSSSSLLNARDLSRFSKEYGLNYYNSHQLNSLETITKEAGAITSSHLILKHPLEEPQATYIEERGKWSTMKDFDERIIWTSDIMPLMASYHKGKLQHSFWVAETTPHPKAVHASSEICTRQISFRRIWQGKCSQSPASKVFLATDTDGVAILCLLLQEQKLMLAVRLQIDEGNDDFLIDIRPHLSWSIPAVDAEPVIVTRPRYNSGLLPFTDVIVLTLDNCLFLYSGKECLCKYLLPATVGNYVLSPNKQCHERDDQLYNLKIVGLGDAVEGRININLSNGQVFRCALRRFPSSSLASDCIAAMAGMHPSFYNHFILLLWGDNDSSYLSSSSTHVDSEWDSFTSSVMKICRRYFSTSTTSATTTSDTAWSHLIHSKFHKDYCKRTSISGISSVAMPFPGGSDYFSANNIGKEQNRDSLFYAKLIRETLDSLHALYENLKLVSLRKRDVGLLAVLLCNIAAALGEASFADYYIRDFPCILGEIGSYSCTVSPKSPPNLFRWLESCLKHGCHSVDTSDIPPLVFNDKICAVGWARKIVCFYSLLLGAERVGRKLSTGVYCDLAKGSIRTKEEVTVLAMVAEKFGRQQLDILPVGVSLPLRHALDKCRESPPPDWPAAAYVLIGREDLAMSRFSSSGQAKGDESNNSADLISNSVPYMLHLRPVTLPSSISDVLKLNTVNFEDTDTLDKSIEDGMEHIFNSSTQLRYGRDMRLNEVRRLLCSARPVAIQTAVSPSASDQDFQQHQLWNLAQRTTSLPFGRGAFTLATTYTLLTEALSFPKLSLAGRLPAQQNATVSLDPNVRNIPELRSWPEFHNGVAAGLRLAPFQGKMSRTWIQYNKPEEPNVTHAGLLLALGLHEHLRVLLITDVYKYLAQEHDITTVGILLGMAASYRGTMHPAVSKMLFLHIPSRHPSSFIELDLPTLLQSAALMAIGFLYEGSAHPLTLKILLGEIGRRSTGDNVLEREGYAVAAGSALGLVALGRGKDAFGFMDTFVDRLFQYIGGKEVYHERYFGSGQSASEHNRIAGQMMDSAQINVDVTAPGATMALALIFLKTESEAVASRLSIPMTHFDLQYVRPDFIMLRIIARNLIMWSRICPSGDWIDCQIPEIVKDGIAKLTDDARDSDEIDVEALVQAYVNIVAGACIALGLKYAGTKNSDAQELLYSYARYFLNEIKHLSLISGSAFPKGISAHVDRGTLEICLHLIVLSLSVVMAGSGHLPTFRLLRYLRSRNSAEGHINFGIQMTVSLAIGFLFLGGGTQTFSTENSAVAALLVTLYPRLPTGPNDNRCHLQAFRHLYVIAAESRWVQTVDVDTGLPVYAPLEVTITEADNYSETSFCEITPCILPERSMLKNVRVCGPRYWPQVIHLVPEDKPWWRSGDKTDPFNGGVLYIKRKVGSCSYIDDPVGCQSLLSRVSDTSHLSSFFTKICSNNEPGSFKVDHLVSTFSADPSLIAFAQLCSDSSWKTNTDRDFQEFCSQVLFECVSKDRPALLQLYLSFYTTVGSMWEQVLNGHLVFHDSLFLSSLKLALAYNDALVSGQLTSTSGGIVQPTFVESIKKRVEEILTSPYMFKDHFHKYLSLGKWPEEQHSGSKMNAILLSWYLCWFGVPPPHIVRSALEKIRSKVPCPSSMAPFLRMLLPSTHTKAITEIDKWQGLLEGGVSG